MTITEAPAPSEIDTEAKERAAYPTSRGVSTLTLGAQLDEIMRDMDAAYAAVRAARAAGVLRRFDSPEYEAVDAVYARLRAWNAAAAAR